MTTNAGPSSMYRWTAFGSVWDDDMPESFNDVQWTLRGEVSVESADEAMEAIKELLYEMRLNEDGIDVLERVEKGSRP